MPRHPVRPGRARVTKGFLEAIAYARSRNPDRLLAVSVVADAEHQDAITRAGAEHEVRWSCGRCTPSTASSHGPS